jgi:hypothetical protein
MKQTPLFRRSVPRKPAVSQRGFAIVISITLLSFLVLLLLSLVLLTRVATQVSDAGLKTEQARQNALLALNLAIGQLEKYAGPDQRTTVPAEFGNPTLNTSAVVSVSLASTLVSTSVSANSGWATMGLVTPAAGTRYWTGVLGNRDPGGQIFTKTPVPALLNWLVSGNESVGAMVTSSYGQITTAPTLASIAFKPNLSISPALSTSTTASTPLQLTSGGVSLPGILLVGPNTVGNVDGPSSTYPTGTSMTATLSTVTVTDRAIDRFVVVPLVTISVAAALMPGASAGASTAVGRYGYWVGDEGVKAKANVRDPYDGQNTAALLTSTATASGRVRTAVAQRFGIERVKGFSPPGSYNATSANSAYYPLDSLGTINSATGSFALEKIQSLEQLRYVDPNGILQSSSLTTLVNPLKLRYHDITIWSLGVLADSQRGGLRSDLTAMFEDDLAFAKYKGRNILPDFDEASFNTASSPTTLGGTDFTVNSSMLDPALPNSPTSLSNTGTYTLSPKRVSPKSRFVYGASQSGLPVENHGPSWDRLRSFYQLPASVTGPAQSPAINVQAADPEHVSVSPVIVQVRTHFGMVRNAAGNFGLRHYVAIVLGNPYSVDLVAPKGLNFVFRQPGLSNPSAQPSHMAWCVELSSSNGSGNNVGDNTWGSSDFSYTNPRSSAGTAGVGLPGGSTTPRAPLNSVLPIINTGMDTNASSTVVNQNRLEQNWQAVPDPLASTMGSVLFHASDTGAKNASLRLPAGKLTVLLVSGNTQTINDPSSRIFSGAPPQIEMIPNPGGVIETSSYIYQTSQSLGTGTKFTQIAYGDNLSIYMLDPNYTKITGDTRTYQAADNSTFVGRVLQAAIGCVFTQGGETPGGQMFQDGLKYGAGGFELDLALAKGTTWNQTSGVGGVSLARGNYFRTYVDYGLTNVYRTRPAYLPNGPNWTWATTGVMDSYLSYFHNDDRANGAQRDFEVYTYGLAYKDSFGWGYDADSIYSDSKTVMYDIPRRLYSGAGNPETPIMSVGYLRHANLSADDEYLSPGYQPASQIGQSFFSPHVTRTASLQPHTNLYFTGVSGAPALTTYYDMSYLLNAAFWDSYFFSSIPTGASSSGQPNNPRLKFRAGVTPTKTNLGVAANTASVTDPATARPYPKELAPARYLMIDGAFNINSTSIEAWKALLTGLRKRVVGPVDSQVATKPTAFPLSIKQPFDSEQAETMDNPAAPDYFGSHGGFRRLTDQQIEALATNIVLEVRARGPFLSLAHLINRTGLDGTVSSTLALLNTAEINDTRTLAGPLQMAIERAGLNSGFPSKPLSSTNIKSGAQATTSDFALGVWTKGYANGSGTTVTINQLYADPLPSGVTTDGALVNSTVNFAMATLNRSTGIPGWLTQADLLQALGPTIAARSDTFVIRAYGDVLDPVNSTTAAPIVQGRAWCEAVVQRLPEYSDSTELPALHPSKANAVNRTFGRKFRIVSFRWLTPADI